MDCPVCLDVYQKPLLLPGCGHTICETCAKVMVTADNFLTCPECRLVYHLRRGIASLPTNIALQRTIYEAQTAQTDKVTCQEHPEDSASLFCHTCNVSICLRCYFTATLKRANSTSGGSRNQGEKETDVGDVSEEKVITAGEGAHYGHNVKTVDDALGKEKRLLEEGTIRLKSLINREKEYVTNLHKTQDQQKIILDEKLAGIEKEKLKLIANIKQTASKLKFTLKGTVVRDSEALQTELNNVQTRLSVMDNLYKEYKLVLDRSKLQSVPIQTFIELRSKLALLPSPDPGIDQEACLRVSEFDTSVASSLQDPRRALSHQTEVPFQPSIYEEDCIISSTSAFIALKYNETVRVEKLVLHYKEALFKGLSEKPWETSETTELKQGKSFVHIRNLEPGCMYKVKVSAHNLHGSSVASKEVLFRTFDGIAELRTV